MQDRSEDQTPMLKLSGAINVSLNNKSRHPLKFTSAVIGSIVEGGTPTVTVTIEDADEPLSAQGE